MGPVTAHPFDVDTSLEAIAHGEYSARVSDRWNALGGEPNGGYLLALCLRALQQEMPLPHPLVVSGFFLRRAAAGPTELRTSIARTGRRLATGESKLIQDDKETVRVLATFTDLDRSAGRTQILARPPDLPPPEEAIDPVADSFLPSVTMAHRVEYRMTALPGWQKGEPSGKPSAAFWMRFREPRDADLLSLVLLVDAYAPVVLEIEEPVSITLELTAHLRAHPAPGWLACRARTRHLVNGYHEEDFEIWDSRGQLVAQSRQLALAPER